MSKLSEARRRIEVMGMAEAQEELKKQRRQLFDLRLQLSRGEVKNNRQFPQIRADIARLMYHISELNREARRELARGGRPAADEAELEPGEAVPELPAPTAEAKPARGRGARAATTSTPAAPATPAPPAATATPAPAPTAAAAGADEEAEDELAEAGDASADEDETDGELDEDETEDENEDLGEDEDEDEDENEDEGGPEAK